MVDIRQVWFWALVATGILPQIQSIIWSESNSGDVGVLGKGCLSGGTWKHKACQFLPLESIRGWLGEILATWEQDEQYYFQRTKNKIDRQFISRATRRPANGRLGAPAPAPTAKIKLLYFKISAVAPQLRTPPDSPSSFTQQLLILT